MKHNYSRSALTDRNYSKFLLKYGYKPLFARGKHFPDSSLYVFCSLHAHCCRRFGSRMQIPLPQSRVQISSKIEFVVNFSSTPLRTIKQEKSIRCCFERAKTLRRSSDLILCNTAVFLPWYEVQDSGKV